VLERSDLADHLADLQVTARIELGVSTLHGFDMFGMGAPGLQRLLGSKAEYRDLLAVLGLELLDRQKARQLADDAVHALAKLAILVHVGSMPEFQVADHNHITDHFPDFHQMKEGTPPGSQRISSLVVRF
jgi:hypothetical protein